VQGYENEIGVFGGRSGNTFQAARALDDFIAKMLDDVGEHFTAFFVILHQQHLFHLNVRHAT
jgi:hypothetical protein